MCLRITEARIVEALATSDEETIWRWFRAPRSIEVDDKALPYLASIAQGGGELDRYLKHVLEKRACNRKTLIDIERLARAGSRVKAYSAVLLART